MKTKGALLKSFKSIIFFTTLMVFGTHAAHAQEAVGMRIGGGLEVTNPSTYFVLDGFFRFDSGFSLESGIAIFPSAVSTVSSVSTSGSISYDDSTPVIVSVAPSYYFKKESFVASIGVPFGISGTRFVTGFSGNFDFIIADSFTFGFDVNSFIVTGEGSYNLTSLGVALGATF